MRRGYTRSFAEVGAARCVLVGPGRYARSRRGQDGSASYTRGLPIIIGRRLGQSVLHGRQQRPTQGWHASVARLVRWLRQIMSGQQPLPFAARNTHMRGEPEESVIALTARER
jgi:hypothetical protein